MDDRSVCLIGVGKVGSALAFELYEAGFKNIYLVDKVLKRVRSTANKLNCVKYSCRLKKEFIAESDIIIISVQDNEIDNVVKRISRLNVNLKDKIFLHTSGALSSEVFEILKINKSCAGSFHPIQTFSKRRSSKSNVFKGIYFGIEGGVNAKKLQKELCAKFESHYIEIPKEKKLIYHTACVIASNFLVTYINILDDLLKNIGYKEEETYKVFEPIIIETLLNISKYGNVKSLTGPFERNDVKTIKGHLKAMQEEHPLLVPFYVSLARETVKVALKKKSIGKRDASELNRILDKYSNLKY